MLHPGQVAASRHKPRMSLPIRPDRRGCRLGPGPDHCWEETAVDIRGRICARSGEDVFPVQITSRQDDIATSVREVGPYSGADVEIRTVALVRNALLRVQFDTVIGRAHV